MLWVPSDLPQRGRSGAGETTSLVVADVNGDGRLDVVVANRRPAAVRYCSTRARRLPARLHPRSRTPALHGKEPVSSSVPVGY